MAIEDLKTKADLDRFLDERLRSLGIADVAGLTDALAAARVSRVDRADLGEDIVVEEASQELPGCEFTADVAMEVLAIAVLDIEGGAAFGRCLHNGAPQPPNVVCDISVSSRGTFGNNWPLSLAQGDEVSLDVLGGAGVEATVYQGHSGLTIVRLS